VCVCVCVYANLPMGGGGGIGKFIQMNHACQLCAEWLSGE